MPVIYLIPFTVIKNLEKVMPLGCGLGWATGIMHQMGVQSPAVLRDVAMATNFERQFAINGFVGYNFGCMIASGTLFDSTGRFLGSSYPMKT